MQKRINLTIVTEAIRSGDDINIDMFRAHLVESHITALLQRKEHARQLPESRHRDRAKLRHDMMIPPPKSTADWSIFTGYVTTFSSNRRRRRYLRRSVSWCGLRRRVG